MVLTLKIRLLWALGWTKPCVRVIEFDDGASLFGLLACERARRAGR